MLVNVLAGLLLLAFGILVVERIIHERELKRWEQVAKLACHALADSVTRPIVVGLASLYVGKDAEVTGPWYEHRDTTALEPVKELRGLLEGVNGMRIFDHKLPSLEPGAGGLIPQQRLRCLLNDREWTEWSIRYLSDLRIAGRAMAAGWAPVVITADKPRLLMNYVAQLNDQLGWLRIYLEETNRHRLAGRSADTGNAIDEGLRRWQLVDARARLLTNFLWREALRDAEFAPYQYALPEPCKSVSLEDAFRAPDAIGRWRPVAEARVGCESSEQ